MNKLIEPAAVSGTLLGVSELYQSAHAQLKSAKQDTDDLRHSRDLIREQRDSANKELAARNAELQMLKESNATLTQGLAASNQQINDLTQTVAGLESEAAKARNVIAAGSPVENSGSLLDMLDNLLDQYRTILRGSMNDPLLRSTVTPLVEALMLTQRTIVGSWNDGFTVGLTGVEMDAIRARLVEAGIKIYNLPAIYDCKCEHCNNPFKFFLAGLTVCPDCIPF